MTDSRISNLEPIRGYSVNSSRLSDYSLQPERANVIVDFSQSAGKQIVLRNDILPVPQFCVSKSTVSDTSSLPSTLRTFTTIQEREAVITHTLTLNEYDNLIGKPMSMLVNGSRWHEPDRLCFKESA